MKELKRIRLGNYLIGMRLEKLPHSIVFRTLVSHVADTAGVLNKFNNTDKMCMFMDFDDRYPIDIISPLLAGLSQSYSLLFHLFKTSENHYNAISTTLISKTHLHELMIRNAHYMDYRFVYVYDRDGCNAMRTTPKLVDGNIYRPIKYIKTFNESMDSRYPNHRGLSIFLHYGLDAPLTTHTDNSTEDDLIIREYETINW